MTRVQWKSILAILPVAVAMTACSHQGMYESQRISNEYECNWLPDAQRRACLDRLPDKDYETYKREREELLRD